MKSKRLCISHKLCSRSLAEHSFFFVPIHYTKRIYAKKENRFSTNVLDKIKGRFMHFYLIDRFDVFFFFVLSE